MIDPVIAWIIALPLATALGWFGKRLLGPSADALGQALSDFLSRTVKRKQVAALECIKLREFIKDNHSSNGHRKFYEQETYLSDEKIRQLLKDNGLFLKRLIKEDFIEQSHIDNYNESDIFFAGMKLFIKELTRKDIKKIFRKYKDNNQASLWPFLEFIEKNKPKLLFGEARGYLHFKQEEWKKQDGEKIKTEEFDSIASDKIRGIVIKWFLIKSLFIFLIVLGLTFYLYWPLYQRIPLRNSEQNLDNEISRLDLPLNEEIREILDRKIDVPKDRHELCLQNNNKFHLLHADSGVFDDGPLIFSTDDLTKYEFGKNNNLGAMAIKLYDSNNSLIEENYRKAGDNKFCVTMEIEKLKNYASSTIEYSTIGLSRLEELDLGKDGKFEVGRQVVGGHFIDTNDSLAYIGARWIYFFVTLITLLVFLFPTLMWVLNNWNKLFLISKRNKK